METESRILKQLNLEAAKFQIGETGLVALDWFNGRRTPYADPRLKGAVIGLTLGTTAPAIFRALVEATAFGSKAIIDRFLEEGIAIEEVIAVGGIAQKSELVMQITADVLGIPIKTCRSEQSCALGAAMCGAVAAGIYDTIQRAQKKMGSGFSKVYQPVPDNVIKYRRLYDQYLKLGRYFNSSCVD